MVGLLMRWLSGCGMEKSNWIIFWPVFDFSPVKRRGWCQLVDLLKIGQDGAVGRVGGSWTKDQYWPDFWWDSLTTNEINSNYLSVCLWLFLPDKKGLVPIGGSARIIGLGRVGRDPVDKGLVLTNRAARSRLESRCCAITRDLPPTQHSSSSSLLSHPPPEPSLSLRDYLQRGW